MKGHVNQSYPKCGLRNRRITRGAHKRLALEFSFGRAGSSLLRGPSSSCREGGLHVAVMASHYGVFSCCRAWALDTWASVVEAGGFGVSVPQALEQVQLLSRGLVAPRHV